MIHVAPGFLIKVVGNYQRLISSQMLFQHSAIIFPGISGCVLLPTEIEPGP